MDNKSKRRAGAYWLDGRPFISVTEILKCINKPSITYWYGQQVYYAMAKDPTLDERTALAAPYRKSGEAANRGSLIHGVIEKYKQTGHIPSAEELCEENHLILSKEEKANLQGYIDAFKHWNEDFKPTIIENERTVVNPTKGYAGTLDMIAEIGGKRHVIDFKTNKDGNIYDEAHMQVSAYLNCDGMSDCDGGIIVALAADGTYTHQIAKNGYIAFLSALDLYVFLNYAKIKALGWSR